MCRQHDGGLPLRMVRRSLASIATGAISYGEIATLCAPIRPLNVTTFPFAWARPATTIDDDIYRKHDA
jgi:hypothetical protein